MSQPSKTGERSTRLQLSEMGCSQFESPIQGAEVAIQQQLKEVVENFSPSKEGELYAAFPKLRRVRDKVMRAAC